MNRSSPIFRSPLPALAVASALAGGELTAQLGPETRINSHVTNHQKLPSVAGGDDGEFLVVWSSSVQDGALTGVFAQRFTAAGGPVGVEFRVNEHTTSFQDYPDVARSPSDGSFLVVWRSFGQDASGSSGVYGRRVDATGAPQGAEFQINEFTTGNQVDPSVAADGLGNFIVSWSSYGQDGSNWGVYARRFDGEGDPLETEFRVNSYTTAAQFLSSVTADDTGRFVVAWSSFDQDGAAGGIFGQRFDDLADPAGVEFQINGTAAPDDVFPEVAASAAGDFVVVWSRSLSGGLDYDVRGRRYDANGAAQGSEFALTGYTTNVQTNPSVAVDDDGRFVATWDSQDRDGQFSGVFARVFDAGGSPLAADFLVNAYTTNAQAYSVVAARGPGKFVVVWQSFLQDGSQYGVYGRTVLAFPLFSDGFESGDVCAWSSVVGGSCL